MSSSLRPLRRLGWTVAVGLVRAVEVAAAAAGVDAGVDVDAGLLPKLNGEEVALGVVDEAPPKSGGAADDVGAAVFDADTEEAEEDEFKGGAAPSGEGLLGAELKENTGAALEAG